MEAFQNFFDCSKFNVESEQYDTKTQFSLYPFLARNRHQTFVTNSRTGFSIAVEYDFTPNFKSLPNFDQNFTFRVFITN